MGTPPFLLIDSDAFVLLAGAGVLEQAIELLGFDPAHALRLSPLPAMLGRGRAFKRYPADLLQRAQIACARIVALESRPDPVLFEQLVSVPDIDEGEALLYATVAEKENWVLLSGDKRAMKALAGEQSLVADRTV